MDRYKILRSVGVDYVEAKRAVDATLSDPEHAATERARDDAEAAITEVALVNDESPSQG